MAERQGFDVHHVDDETENLATFRSAVECTPNTGMGTHNTYTHTTTVKLMPWEKKHANSRLTSNHSSKAVWPACQQSQLVRLWFFRISLVVKWTLSQTVPPPSQFKNTCLFVSTLFIADCGHDPPKCNFSWVRMSANLPDLMWHESFITFTEKNTCLWVNSVDRRLDREHIHVVWIIDFHKVPLKATVNVSTCQGMIVWHTKYVRVHTMTES